MQTRRNTTAWTEAAAMGSDDSCNCRALFSEPLAETSCDKGSGPLFRHVPSGPLIRQWYAHYSPRIHDKVADKNVSMIANPRLPLWPQITGNMFRSSGKYYPTENSNKKVPKITRSSRQQRETPQKYAVESFQ